jgi:opacity protein-like surface antigen
MLAMPMKFRFDFLRWFFADAGVLFALQPGGSDIGNMTGPGVTLGTGFQYNFRSDVFIRVRAYGNQYGLLHLFPEDHPRTLSNAGVTLGVGYQFIHLGRCNCPDDNSPRKRFH